jgi:NADPH-dependent 2,4-dienoyl-CoA reductase/sulfur reductase-like enzyme
MKMLADKGLTDWVSIINGSHWSFPELIAPMARPRAEHADLARDFTMALNVPVVVSGRIRTPAEAEHILASGAADIVGMARTLIAEPNWPIKVAAGDEARIRPCLSCNQGCLAFAIQHLAGTCIVNPAAGRESELGDIEPAADKKTIAVIGGGPAGLEAARVAALRGHQVTLYEAEGHLGGALRLAAGSPHRGEMAAALVWWISELAALGVTINIATSVDPAKPPVADVVVWAIGAAPAITRVWQRRPHLRDGIPGTQGLPMGRDVMTGAAGASGTVLVIDEEGGWPTVSLVDHLAEDPAVGAITVVTPGADICGPALDHTLERADVLRRFENTTVRVLPNTLVAAVENGSVDLLDGARLGPYDAIILATGTASRAYPDDALAAGDCIAPRGIWAATNDAHRLSRML